MTAKTKMMSETKMKKDYLKDQGDLKELNVLINQDELKTKKTYLYYV